MSVYKVIYYIIYQYMYINYCLYYEKSQYFYFVCVFIICISILFILFLFNLFIFCKGNLILIDLIINGKLYIYI